MSTELLSRECRRFLTVLPLAMALAPLAPLALTPTLAKQPEAAAASAPVSAQVVAEARPATWAQPVAVAGVPNLNRVTPTFYRSAQPLKAGFPNLGVDPGIKTVVSLRAFHSDAKLAKATDLRLVSVPINTWKINTRDIVRALAEIRRAEANGPVLLHCQHGADRTGLVSALYRMIYQGWSKADAEAEMRQGNYGYHAVWGNIPRFIANADLADIKRQVEAAKF